MFLFKLKFEDFLIAYFSIYITVCFYLNAINKINEEQERAFTLQYVSI